jgi:hypothetical protein
MDLAAETAVIEAKLALPSREELRPYVQKLVAHPGSAIVIGIEIRAGEPRVGRAWLNTTERQALRTALERVNAARKKRSETLTDQEVK